MVQLQEDDLFRHSSMSFGDHLEELRSRLFRAALWLLGGVIVGFIVGGPVVSLLESPMERALAEFYINKTTAELSANGATIPSADQVLIREGYISDEVFVQPSLVLKELSQKFPELAKPIAGPKSAGRTNAAPGADPAVPSAQGPITKPADAAVPPSKNPAGNTPNASSEGAAASADALLLRITIWRESKNDPRVQLQSFNATEPFMIYLKAALLTGAILSSPFVFREIWLFVAAGLYPHERRYVYIFLPLSVGLFIAGVLMAFFVAFPTVLHFLLGFNQYLMINPQQRIEEFFDFVLFLPLAFGIGFQLPLVMLFINRIGMISVQTYVKQWRIAILAIFVIAMILTPSPDVYTMSLLAVPMSLLYFGGIALCKYTSGRRPAGLGGE